MQIHDPRADSSSVDMSHPSADSNPSGIQLPSFSSLLNSIGENGSDSHSYSRVQSSSVARASDSVNNSSYPAQIPASHNQLTDPSRGHRYDISYLKAPSDDYKSPLNDYTFYRKFESASEHPALQVGSAGSRPPTIGYSSSCDSFTAQSQHASMGRNNHTSAVAPGRVMGAPHRRPVGIPPSTPRPSPHQVPQPLTYDSDITFLEPETIHPQAPSSSSIPKRKSKFTPMTCRINNCNTQCLGKKALEIHLQTEHNLSIGPMVVLDETQWPWNRPTHVCNNIYAYPIAKFACSD